MPAGACYHALGFHRSAVRDYSQAFSIEQKDSSNEVKMQQFLAFYQVTALDLGAPHVPVISDQVIFWHVHELAL